MAFGAGDTVGIEPVGGIRFAAAGDRGHVLPEPQTVVIIATAFIILGDQLQLAVIIDLNRPRPHHVEAVRVLEPRLGIIEDQRIVIAVVPAAETLIGYRQAAGCVVCSAADGRRDALIMIVAVRKTALAAHLKIDLTILLPLLVTMLISPPVLPPPYSEVAPEITSICSMLNGSMASSWRLSVREELSRTPSISTAIARPRMFIHSWSAHGC